MAGPSWAHGTGECMNRGQLFLEELRETILLGDGALGSVLVGRGAPPEAGVERLNVTAPDLVLALHREYVAAGSRVIETNTFAANAPSLARHGDSISLREVILAGVSLARQAATPDTYVAGSVGPLPMCEGEPCSLSDQIAFVREQVGFLLEGGVDVLIFETFADSDELVNAVRVARSMTDIPIVAQAAFEINGLTPFGDRATDMAAACLQSGANVVGANCGYGMPALHEAIRRMGDTGSPLSAYFNAGFPERVEGRLLYRTDPDYLLRRALDLVSLGVSLIGGCCGVGPDVIRSLGQALGSHPRVAHRAVAPRPAVARPKAPAPLEELAAGTPGRVLVELDPPTQPDVSALTENALQLKAMGVDAVTIADNPLASVRVDALSTAAMLQRECGIPLVPHLTGRDRNRIALQSAVMAACAWGIRYILCVTGDPVRMSQESNTSGVFDVNSVGLVKLAADVRDSRQEGDAPRRALSIGVALNPNARNLGSQVDRLKRKIEAGADFALTQPIFAEDRLEALQEALTGAGVDIPIYWGILPLTSLRNAEFIHNEVPGIQVPDSLREEMARFEAVADQRAAATEACTRLIQSTAPRAHGFYIIAPRNRVELLRPLVAAAFSEVQRGRL